MPAIWPCVGLARMASSRSTRTVGLTNWRTVSPTSCGTRGSGKATVSMRWPAASQMLYIAALGTLKNRSVFCPLFSAFDPEPIRTRMTIGQAKVLMTTETLYERKVVGIRVLLPDGVHHRSDGSGRHSAPAFHQR